MEKSRLGRVKMVGFRCSDEVMQKGKMWWAGGRPLCSLPVSAITASPLALGSETTFSGQLKRTYWSFQDKCTEMCCLISLKIRLFHYTEKAAVTLFQLRVLMCHDWCTVCSRAKAKYIEKHSSRHGFLQEFSDSQFKFSFANKNSLLPREFFFFFPKNWAIKLWEAVKTFLISYFVRSPA